MGDLNRVFLLGRLTRDPELRYTPSGAANCVLAIATNTRPSKNEAGEPTREADYHDVIAWNNGNRKLAELCAQYLAKGSQVMIEGRLQTRSWDDANSGQKKYKTEVVASDVMFVGAKRD